MERVGDWVCLECNNLNFGFRDVCNRCDADRVNVGKTIMSQHELDAIKMNPTAASSNNKEQINLVCDLAMATVNMRDNKSYGKSANNSYESIHSFGSHHHEGSFIINQQLPHHQMHLPAFPAYP